jgi:heme exporter protein B
VNFALRALVILQKDLVTEWRTKERLSTMVFFVLLVLLVFNFSFELGGYALHEIGPGVLWSSYVFASLLGLNRTFAAERENGCLDALLLSLGDRSALFVAKMLGNLIFLLVVQLLSLPLFALFFNLSVDQHLLPLLVLFLLGSASLSAVGTLFAVMSSNSRLREMLLPLLVLPMSMPALISCVQATGAVFAQRGMGTVVPYIQILAVYVAVFTTLAILLFEYVVEE